MSWIESYCGINESNKSKATNTKDSTFAAVKNRQTKINRKHKTKEIDIEVSL